MKQSVIIIPVHNQVDYLKVCVASVYEKTTDPKVIIIDDGSTDKETSQWIDNNKKHYGYEIIRHKTPLGFSIACNDGIIYALNHYDFTVLCLLNSDTEINTERWFRKVECFFENGDKIGTASVMSDNALAQTVNNTNLYLKTIQTKPTVYTILPHGFCYFISKELIEEIGTFDEVMFPHYGSEDDYSLSSIKAGFKNLLIGSVFVHHENNKSYTEKQRTMHVSKSVPALKKKWGQGYVNRAGVYSNKAANYIKRK